MNLEELKVTHHKERRIFQILTIFEELLVSGVATVSVFLTVGFSPARCSSGRSSIWMEHAATVALSKVSLL
jgi:hypothetical protein